MPGRRLAFRWELVGPQRREGPAYGRDLSTWRLVAGVPTVTGALLATYARPS